MFNYQMSKMSSEFNNNNIDMVSRVLSNGAGAESNEDDDYEYLILLNQRKIEQPESEIINIQNQDEQHILTLDPAATKQIRPEDNKQSVIKLDQSEQTNKVFESETFMNLHKNKIMSKEVGADQVSKPGILEAGTMQSNNSTSRYPKHPNQNSTEE